MEDDRHAKIYNSIVFIVAGGVLLALCLVVAEWIGA